VSDLPRTDFSVRRARPSRGPSGEPIDPPKETSPLPPKMVQDPPRRRLTGTQLVQEAVEKAGGPPVADGNGAPEGGEATSAGSQDEASTVANVEPSIPISDVRLILHFPGAIDIVNDMYKLDHAGRKAALHLISRLFPELFQ
jgi:hypothetical protein